MRFGWDPEKYALVLEKHGIDFADAARIFLGNVIEWCDARDWGEVRIAALGCLDGIEIVVVYTDRADLRWLITARRARTKERKLWRATFG